MAALGLHCWHTTITASPSSLCILLDTLPARQKFQCSLVFAPKNDTSKLLVKNCRCILGIYTTNSYLRYGNFLLARQPSHLTQEKYQVWYHHYFNAPSPTITTTTSTSVQSLHLLLTNNPTPPQLVRLNPHSSILQTQVPQWKQIRCWGRDNSLSMGGRQMSLI